MHDRAQSPLFLGIDCGTSAVRAVLATATGEVHASAHYPLANPIRSPQGEIRQEPKLWWSACAKALDALARAHTLSSVRAISICATSGTILLADGKGEALAAARMYNDPPPQTFRARIERYASADALARLLALYEECKAETPHYAVLQADYLAARLGAPLGVSDDNNCLKLGYDAAQKAFPPWIEECAPQITALLPRVYTPGTEIGRVDANSVARFGFPTTCALHAGTTDGVAAFIAAGQRQLGQAVTSLGSTLTVKILSDKPLAEKASGVYSHKLGEHWLAGGASNSGGMAIRRFFSLEEITRLSRELRPDQPTGLSYYPLPATGERFPIADANLQPCFSPRVQERSVFLQAILEGIATIEKRAYDRLAAIGAPRLRSVATTGGGAGNEAWRKIRERILGVPVFSAAPAQREAALGSARLAAGMAF